MTHRNNDTDLDSGTEAGPAADGAAAAAGVTSSAGRRRRSMKLLLPVLLWMVLVVYTGWKALWAHVGFHPFSAPLWGFAFLESVVVLGFYGLRYLFRR